MAIEHSRYLMEQPIHQVNLSERALAVRAISKRAENPEDYLTLLSALGLDDDAHIIGQPMELGISDAATGPLTSGSGSDSMMP